MSRILSFLALVLATSGCFEPRKEVSWDLKEISSECRSSPPSRALFLKLNLCKQESRMLVKLPSCVNETWTSWQAQSEKCRAETASTALSASSFFWNQALVEWTQEKGVPAQERLKGQLEALRVWIESLPSQLSIDEFEALFQKIYLRIHETSLDQSLETSTGGEIEGAQVASSLQLLENYLQQRDQGLYTDLLLLQGFNDLVSATEPKIKLLLQMRRLSCEFDACPPPPQDLEEYLAMVSQMVEANGRVAAATESTGVYGAVSKTLARARPRLQIAGSRYREAILASREGLEAKTQRLQKSRLYDFEQTLTRFKSYHRSLLEGGSKTSGPRRLTYGLSRESTNQITNYLLESSRSFLSLASDYKGLSQQAKQNLKENLSNQTALDSILLEQNLELQNLTRLRAELLGLSNAYLEAEESYAQFQAKFSRLPISPGALGAMWSSTPVFEGLSVSGSDAKFDPEQVSPELGDLSFKKIELEAGEALGLQVQGEWGPTCALARHVPELVQGQILTGPSGYFLSQSDGKSRLESREQFARIEHTLGRSSRASACSTFGLSVSLPMAFSPSSNSSYSNCQESFRSRSASFGSGTTWRDENFRSESLNLQAGLSLPSTPFPTLPAGSLLAAIQGSAGKRYQVVNRSARIEVSEASTVYLLVNDCSQQVAQNAAQLTVDASKLKTADAEVRRDLAFASLEVERLYSKAAKLFASGVDIEGELQLMAQEARAAIYAQTVSFSRFDVARQYLEQLLLFKTQQLSRKAKIIERAYRLAEGEARFASSARSEQFNVSQSDLLILEGKKIAEDLTLAGVGPRLSDFSRELTEQILPVINFQADSTDIQPFIANSLRELETASRLDSNLGRLSQAISNLSRDLASALNQSREFIRYRNQYDDVLIAVPNPEIGPGKSLDKGTPTLKGRSQLALWQALFGTGKQDLSQVVFQLAASDVYGDNYASGGVSCNSRQPVIEDIALAFVTRQTDLSRDDLRLKSRNLDVPLRIGPGFQFPSSRGPLEFKVIDPSEGISNARFGLVRKDAFEDAYDLLRSPADLSGAGKGLSPFGDWSFKADALRAFVRANGELFYQNPGAGALLAADKLPVDQKQDLGDFFTDDFADFALQPGAEENSEIASLEKFPRQITDILILIRFSSLTSTDPSLMSWIEACR